MSEKEATTGASVPCLSLLDSAIRLADASCSEMTAAYFKGGFDLRLVHDLANAFAAASDASGKLKALKAKIEAGTSNTSGQIPAQKVSAK